jgi:cytochrome c oxidase cbb3-type subunit III
MQVSNRVIAGAIVGLTIAVAVRVTAQGQPPPTPPPAQTPPAQTPPAQPPTEGHGRQPQPGAQPAAPPPTSAQQRPPQGPARFPAHQRPPADPAVLARGRQLYVGACSACHGVDARGGQLGGPNLLRSQLVLNDKDGEAILPVVQNGRPGTLMVPIPMAVDDVKAVATFLHDLQAQGSNQGGPPPGEEPVLDILVGDAKAGERYFSAKCASCHSPTGDLQGIATRLADAKVLQNTWVSGGLAGGRFGRGGGPPRPPSERRIVKATVTLPSGETIEGALVRLDDFLVTLQLSDGTRRSVSRTGEVPKVEIRDPLAEHRALLAAYTDKDMHDVTAYLATIK